MTEAVVRQAQTHRSGSDQRRLQRGPVGEAQIRRGVYPPTVVLVRSEDRDSSVMVGYQGRTGVG